MVHFWLIFCSRIKPGDRVAYYSPTVEFGGKYKFQTFTAIGIVQGGDPYQVDMGGGFQPYRRDVCWFPAVEAPIRPILGMLEFSAEKQNWGYQFRFGIFVISEHDMNVITAAMGLELSRAASYGW
ncbi:EVE domain-containing protein [Acidithiobacillus thiooxidans]|uniref:EVE domain-containing protein n=1 Tax=Acidithiobacillus thiooxidans TaxID=930 RepID=UPI00098387BC|nr:EVE domain-containing protein [Acidithiobacillus thiooxidans]